MRDLGGPSVFLAMGVGLAIAWLELVVKHELYTTSLKPCIALLPLLLAISCAWLVGRACGVSVCCASGSLLGYL